MADLKMNISPEVVIGSINRLGEEAVYLGSRVLLMADSSLEEKIDLVKEILESRGLKVLLFTNTTPETTSFTLKDSLSMARGSHSNLIIGLGGIKTLHLARATASLAKEKIFIEDYLRGDSRPDKGLPYIEVPTSGRDSFMFRNECFITENREKYSRICPMPEDCLKLVFLDPIFLDTLSSRYIYMILMDIMLHGLEGYLHPRASFFSDLQASQSIRLLSDELGQKKGKGFEIENYSRVYEASLFSAYALALNGMGPVTVMSQVLSSYTGKPKAAISSVLLPSLLETSFYPMGEKKKNLAKLCYHPYMAEDFKTLSPSEVMRRFQGLHELPSNFADISITPQQLSEAASLTYSLLEDQMTSLSLEALFEVLQGGM